MIECNVYSSTLNSRSTLLPTLHNELGTSLHNLTNACLLQTETALIYDAVKLLSAGLQDLDRSQAVTIEPISCDNGNPWQHGSSLINYMRPVAIRHFCQNK